MSKEQKLKTLLFGGSDRTKQAKINVWVSFLIKGVSILVSLVLVPLTLSYLTPFDYGVWLTLNSILVWLDFFDVGLGNGLRNKLSECIALKDFEKAKRYVSTTFFLMTLLGISVILIFCIINSFLDWNLILNTGDHEIENLNTTVSVVFGLCVLNFVLKIIGNIFMAYQRPMMSNLFSCIGQIFALIIIFIFTKVTTGSLAVVAITYSLSPILVYIISYPYTFKYKYKEIAPSIKYIDFSYGRDIFNIGIEFFFIQVTCLILYQTGNIIVANIFSPADVTPYNITYRYMNIILMVYMIVITPLWSAITDAFTKRDIKWITNSINKMVLVWLAFSLCAIIMVIFYPFIIKIWIGDSVVIERGLVIGFAVYTIIDMWSRIFASFANGVTHLRIQLIIAVIEAILYIPLTFLLSDIWGIQGVAWALAIVSLFPAVFLYLDYNKCITQLSSRYNSSRI